MLIQGHGLNHQLPPKCVIKWDNLRHILFLFDRVGAVQISLKIAMGRYRVFEITCTHPLDFIFHHVKARIMQSLTSVEHLHPETPKALLFDLNHRVCILLVETFLAFILLADLFFLYHCCCFIYTLVLMFLGLIHHKSRADF